MRTSGGFWSVLLSFWLAVIFCAVYATLVYVFASYSSGADAAGETLQFFFGNYGGLITGTACASVFLMSILVLRVVPTLIESAVTPEQFDGTSYKFWKERSLSFRLSMAQFSTYFAGGFAIYSLLEFPVPTGLQVFFVVFTAFQFAFGGMIGRKLWCVGHMLRSLEDVEPNDDLLEIEALPRLI